MLISVVDDAAPEVVSPASAPRALADVRDVLLALVATDVIEIKLELSAINTVARALHCAPEDLPANPARLREQLKLVSPAMAGLAKASWATVRSRVQKALQRGTRPSAGG